MPGFTLMGKMLIIMGILLILIGIIMTAGPKIPWIGRLPGDIIIKKDDFSLYFPLTSCIIMSIILTFLFYLLRK
jgi:hypothetical protein